MPWRQSRSATGRGPGDRSSQVGSSGSISPTSRRPRSTAEYSHHHERPNRLTGHARPGHLNKIVLRALMSHGFRRAMSPLPRRNQFHLHRATGRSFCKDPLSDSNAHPLQNPCGLLSRSQRVDPDEVGIGGFPLESGTRPSAAVNVLPLSSSLLLLY